MKILVASDIHGRLKAMEKFLAVLAKEDPDKIILLGDYLYNGPRNGVPDDYDPMKVSEQLNLLKDYIIGIRGNCDSRVDGMLLHFPLEDFRDLSLNGQHCVLTHGDLLDSPSLVVKPGDLFMYGHTHIYQLGKYNGVTVLNPGSISFPKNGNVPSYAIFNEDKIVLKNFLDMSIIKSLDL
jgi:putative phosphoesterase